jgi:23S rRNA (cytosine1962-C5)-methyltransferase
VNSRAAKRLRNGHVWVYRSDVLSSDIPSASLVHVTEQNGRFLASALSSSSSQISLRVISRERVSDTGLAELVRERIENAVRYRKNLVRDTNAYRVVFSEADSLPGLTIDKYAEVFSLQASTQAMNRDELRAAAVRALRQEYGDAISIFERMDARMRKLEALPEAESKLLYGETTATQFDMNGLRFHFDAAAGQKTGAFLDQRENYVAAAKYAHGKALDMFTYQGGFAVHLGRVCQQVMGVDVSRAALEQAERNEQANAAQMKCGEIEWLEADAFELLKDYSQQGAQYETIVLDPPAFAKTQKAVDKALTGYKEVNLRALKMLKPGGVLVTNSCSHHVSEADFSAMLASSAADAGRFVTILEKRTQSQDHPIVATIPETAYLKCIICQVG